MTEVVLSGAVVQIQQQPLPPASNPYDVYLATLSNDESRRAMAGCLDRIALILFEGAEEIPAQAGRYVPWGELRYVHTAAVRARLLQGTTATGDPFSPAYIKKHLTAMRSTLKTAWRLEQMSGEDYQRAIDLEKVSGERLPVGRNIAVDEVAAMLSFCLTDPSPAGTRDAALIAWLQSTGARREEAASALLEDYDAGDRTHRIIGKRNKQRELDIHGQAAVYLGRWLAVLNRRQGPIFCPIDKWGNVASRKLTPAAISQIINRRRRQAGLPALSPHDFRKTFIGDMLDNGADLSTAQQAAGHSSPVTTAAYDRRPRRTRKAAVERLSHLLPSPEDLMPTAPLPRDDSSET